MGCYNQGDKELKQIKCISCGKTFPPKWGTMELKQHESDHRFKGYELIK